MTRRFASTRSAAVAASLACLLSARPGLAEHLSIPVDSLGTYRKLDASGVTVSGISSGAFFAHQFHIAFSGLVKGAGLVAGGPFGCADAVDGITPPFGNPFVLALVPRRVVASLAICTNFGRSDFKEAGWSFPARIDVEALAQAAMRAHAAGTIDDPANVAASRVFVFHGSRDTTVPKPVTEALAAFYRRIGVPDANIVVADGPDAKHGMPIKVDPLGTAARHCRLPDPSFLIRCDYGAAELLLRHLYPGAAAAGVVAPAPGRIVGFDQTEFFDESEKSTSLGEAGYLYVPAACENAAPAPATCRLHVAFHGCEQYVDKIHDLFFRDAGYNAFADAHAIVILYPQATPWLRLADVSQITGNPKGCWDWWGYSGDDYLGRSGKQMKAVRAMIGRLLP